LVTRRAVDISGVGDTDETIGHGHQTQDGSVTVDGFGAIVGELGKGGVSGRYGKLEAQMILQPQFIAPPQVQTEIPTPEGRGAGKKVPPGDRHRVVRLLELNKAIVITEPALDIKTIVVMGPKKTVIGLDAGHQRIEIAGQGRRNAIDDP